MTQTDEDIYHVFGLENQYCQNDYTTPGIYRFNAIHIKIPKAFLFSEPEQIILNFK